MKRGFIRLIMIIMLVCDVSVVCHVMDLMWLNDSDAGLTPPQGADPLKAKNVHGVFHLKSILIF